jgi:serine/threonine protein kinase
MLSRLDHPNIIKILGAGKVPRRFIVLEYLEETVTNVLTKRTKQSGFSLFRKPVFTYSEILEKSAQLASALHYIHDLVHTGATILHRDLKPDNVGLGADGSLKLFDFGLSTCVNRRTSPLESYKMTGNTGSLRYMAPEVVLSKPYNEKVLTHSYSLSLSFTHSYSLAYSYSLLLLHSLTHSLTHSYSLTLTHSYSLLLTHSYSITLTYSLTYLLTLTLKVDVYSFGIILWQLASEATPFKGFSRDDFLCKVVAGDERPKIDKSWPNGFTSIIVSCWHKDPLQRPPFATIVERLQGLIDELNRSRFQRGKSIFKNVESPELSEKKSEKKSGWF